jgi:type III pantothenate kinase
MMLLFDLGNSRLKWATWDGATLVSGAAVDHSRPLDAALSAAWRDAPPVRRALVASVARPRLEAELSQAVRGRFGIECEFVATRAQAGGVRVAYAKPEKLGVDRFLALVALHAIDARPWVLASVGTALVLDALAADGRHLGGLIAPNPTLMQQALLDATARVSAADAARVVEIATDTEDAVRSGCWLAAAALVERFHGSATDALGGAPSLVLAGGAAEQLQPHIRVPARIETDLVLRGLLAIARGAA